MRMLSSLKMFNIIINPIFVIFILNLVFFLKPLLSGLNLSPADILQSFQSFNLGQFHSPENSLLFDPVTQFHPWLIYTKSILISKQLPLWNDLNGGGVPLLANGISALFFPLSFVFYLTNFKISMLIVSFTKLFLIGVLTYLYLREINIRKYPSLIGAICFNYAGFNIVWLMWPQSNVVLLLPLVLLLVEKHVSSRITFTKFYIFFALVIFLGIAGGHPETLLHISLVSLFYFIFRLRMSKIGTKLKIAKIKVLLFSIVHGLMISAVLILPFLQYLVNSSIIYSRSNLHRGIIFPAYTLIYNLLPNILGNPSSGFYKSPENYNYNELVGGYTGMTSLFCLFSTLFIVRKHDKYIIFFLLVIFAAIPFIYYLPLISGMAVFLNKYFANTRLLLLLSFAASVITAFYFDNLKRLKNYRKLLLLLTIIAVLGTLSFLTIVQLITPFLSSQYSPSKLQGFALYQKLQILIVIFGFIFAVYLQYLLLRSNKTKNYIYIIIAVCIFIQTGFININYNPSISDNYFYPKNEAVAILQKLPKGKYIELGGGEILPPNINLVYGLANIRSYDALDIRHYKESFDSSFPKKNEWGQILEADQKSLDLFGVKYILTYTSIDKYITPTNTSIVRLSRPIFGDYKLTQKIHSENNYLQGIRLLMANYNRDNNCDVKIFLYDTTHIELFTENYSCGIIFDKSYFQIDFPTIDLSQGKDYFLELQVVNGDADNNIAVWLDRDSNMVYQKIYDNNKPSNLTQVYDGSFKIYENKAVYSEYYLISDPKNLSGSLIINTNLPTYKKIIIDSKNRNILASTNAFYPGWRAYIDSHEVTILEYEKAFQSIIIPKGRHTIEFVYDPLVYKLGAAISIVGFALFLNLKKSPKYEHK